MSWFRMLSSWLILISPLKIWIWKRRIVIGIVCCFVRRVMLIDERSCKGVSIVIVLWIISAIIIKNVAVSLSIACDSWIDDIIDHAWVTDHADSWWRWYTDSTIWIWVNAIEIVAWCSFFDAYSIFITKKIFLINFN